MFNSKDIPAFLIQKYLLILTKRREMTKAGLREAVSSDFVSEAILLRQ